MGEEDNASKHARRTIGRRLWLGLCRLPAVPAEGRRGGRVEVEDLRALLSVQPIHSLFVVPLRHPLTYMSAPKPSSKFLAYSNALKAISARTGTPLSSLVLSFGIVHEVTALAPLFISFYTARAFGVGDTLIKAITEDPTFTAEDDGQPKGLTQWGKHKLSGWVVEGDRWAARVGTRYGIFGYEKRQPGEKPDVDALTHRPGHLAGDVANAVVAYAVTKVRCRFILGLMYMLNRYVSLF